MAYTAPFKNVVIYIYRINYADHAGCLKIGETTAPDGLYFQPNCKELNDAVKKRINEQTQTAGVKYELLHTELTLFSKNGKVQNFNDKQVHEILLRSGIKKKVFDIEGRTDEWFVCDLETAKNAITAAKNGQSCLDPNQKSDGKSPIIFRPEQKRAIEQTKKVLKHGNKMLWNAKMRMGKTLASLELVKQMKFKRTIIITHRPVVIDGWSKDFEKIFFETDTDWRFGSREIGARTIAELEKSGKNYIYFASIQDLRGSKIVSGKFDKNEDVFKTNWDLVIIDEAHEGTQTEKGQSVQEMLTKENTKVINLSGTPFNLLETNEYDENNTFTWDYVMEQRAKQEWALTHPGDYNPYEELPKLNLLTFNLGALVAKYQDEDKAFNFTEFFRTKESGEFVHEKDVRRFLDIISSEKGETLYPFSSQQYREFFHHTFWIVPGVKEGKALKEMLDHHPIFGVYNVVNVCGKEDEETTGDPLEDVRNAIGECPENTYTITLSCRRLTTGVTVREWTAVLYLAGSKNTSPAAYMQTIFRVQSPGRIGGRMKTDCYVFDFAPDRTLKMVVEAAKVSAKAGETTEDDRQILGDFLNFCPIISCEGTEMKPYNVEQMMRQLKRVYVDKVVNSGFEDGHLYSKKLLNLSDVELDSFANLREIIGQTKASNKIPEIPINQQGFDNKDIENVQKEHKKKTGRELTEEEARQLLELQQKRKQRDIAVSILRGISIRMPLLLYGAKLDSEEEQITLDRFVELVDDQSWAEFMPQGVTKDRFADYKQYYDEDIFAAAGHQIRQLALNADKLPVLQRIQHITQIFDSFRNPDKETVLTPWRVVNMHLSDTIGGYSFYADDFPYIPDEEPHLVDRGVVTQRLFENANVRFLEINSKSGLYPLYVAYSVFRYRLRVLQESKRSLFKQITVDEEQKVWRNVLEENIFIICKTEMARSITQRTLAGFTDAKINTHVYDDLLNQITNKQNEFIKKLLSGGIFPKIKNMKFDAIVGNPPYQETLDNKRGLAKQLFPEFVKISTQLKASYVSLITPLRWFTAEAQDGSFIKLREYFKGNRHFQKMFSYPNSDDVFKEEIAGGVNYFLYSDLYDGDTEFHVIINGKDSVSTRPLFEDGIDIVIYDQKIYRIIEHLKKVGFTPISDITTGRDAFGIVGTKEIVKKNSYTSYFDGAIELRCAHEEIRYISRDIVTKSKEFVDKWKVFTSKANGGAGTLGYGKPVAIIGKAYIGKPNSVCTDSLLPFGCFSTEQEAVNLQKYMKTKFFRFCVGILKTSQNLCQIVYQFVPLQDFSSKSDIDWSKPVAKIDEQLYEKYGLSGEEQAFIEGMIKEME